MLLRGLPCAMPLRESWWLRRWGEVMVGVAEGSPRSPEPAVSAVDVDERCRVGKVEDIGGADANSSISHDGLPKHRRTVLTQRQSSASAKR